MLGEPAAQRFPPLSWPGCGLNFDTTWEGEWDYGLELEAR